MHKNPNFQQLYIVQLLLVQVSTILKRMVISLIFLVERIIYIIFIARPDINSLLTTYFFTIQRIGSNTKSVHVSYWKNNEIVFKTAINLRMASYQELCFF